MTAVFVLCKVLAIVLCFVNVFSRHGLASTRRLRTQHRRRTTLVVLVPLAAATVVPIEAPTAATATVVVLVPLASVTVVPIEVPTAATATVVVLAPLASATVVPIEVPAAATAMGIELILKWQPLQIFS